MQPEFIAKTDIDGFKQSNERLEYLGDAVLGLVVAEYLYEKYPYEREGFLTEIRSRIVSRESLNQLAFKMELNHLLNSYNEELEVNYEDSSIYGNALEALIGALYLDKGFKYCKNFITYSILKKFYNLEKIIKTIVDFKSRILSWSQKNNKKLTFIVIRQDTENTKNQFKVNLFLDEKLIAEGFGRSKKKAEQDASQKAYEIMK